MYVIRKAQEHHRNVESHLYKRVCPSVGPSVGRSVRNASFFNWIFVMYVIRKAQEHHRNVELHLYGKVRLSVRPYIRELS